MPWSRSSEAVTTCFGFKFKKWWDVLEIWPCALVIFEPLTALPFAEILNLLGLVFSRKARPCMKLKMLSTLSN